MGAGIYLTFMVDVKGKMVFLSLKQDQEWVQHDCALWVLIPWDLCWQQRISLCGPWVCPSMAIPIFYGVMILKMKIFSVMTLVSLLVP